MEDAGLAAQVKTLSVGEDKKATELEDIPRGPGECRFFLRRKGKWCKHPAMGGSEFCTFHEAPTEEGSRYCEACKTRVVIKKWCLPARVFTHSHPPPLAP